MEYITLAPKITTKITIAHIAMGNQQSTMNDITKKLGLAQQEPKSKIFGDYTYIISMTQKQYEAMWKDLNEAYSCGIISGAMREVILEVN